MGDETWSSDTNPMGLGASLMTSFNPDHLHEDPSLNIVTLGMEASTYEFEGTQFSPQHTDGQLVTIRSLLCTGTAPAGATPPVSPPRWELLSLAHFTGQASKAPRGSQPPRSPSSGGIELRSECDSRGSRVWPPRPQRCTEQASL